MLVPTVPSCPSLFRVLLVLGLPCLLGCPSSAPTEDDFDLEIEEPWEEEAPPTPPPSFPEQWTIQSPNGRWLVRQSTADGEICTVRAVDRDSDETAWEARRCLATRDDIRLLSPDGEGILVISPRPPLDVSPVGDIPVAVLFRRGEEIRTFIAREFIDPTRFEVIEDGLVWLAHGPNGPLLRHAGEAAELTLEGSRLAVISFDGEVELSEPVAPSGPKPEEKPDSQCPPGIPCSYVDSRGVFHVVEGVALVPEEYLGSARPLDGGVTEVGATNSANDIVIPSPIVPRVREAPRAGRAGSTSPQELGPRSSGRLGREPNDSKSDTEGAPGEPRFEETVMERAIRLGTRAGAPLPAPMADPDSATRYEPDRTGAMVPINEPVK